MSSILPEYLTELTHQSSRLLMHEFIEQLTQKFPGQVIFSTSFSYEDQVITHEILSNELAVNIFTLDTGRLFAETYSVWNSTNEKYKARIRGYYPDHHNLEKFIQEKGPNSFYESVENRKS